MSAERSKGERTRLAHSIPRMRAVLDSIEMALNSGVIEPNDGQAVVQTAAEIASQLARLQAYEIAENDHDPTTFSGQHRVTFPDPVPEEAVVRFFEKISRSGEDACWPWCGESERFHLTKTQACTPRRLSWWLAFKEEPPFQIATTCRSKTCMNPKHFVRSEEQKFWSLVKKADGDACWEWQGGLVKKTLYRGRSYGGFAPRTGVLILAHRYSYELAHGKIEGHVGHDPEREICVLHRCDNPLCVRPEHLFLGSDKDNIRDMIAKGRAGWQKARASADHHLSETAMNEEKKR